VPRFALPSWVLPWVLVPAAVVVPFPRPFLLLGGCGFGGAGIGRALPSCHAQVVQTLTPWLAKPPPDPELAETPPGGVKARAPLLLFGLSTCEPCHAAPIVAPCAGGLQNGLERLGSGPRRAQLFPVWDWTSPGIDDPRSHGCFESELLQGREKLGAHGKPALQACGWHPWIVQAHAVVQSIWFSFSPCVLEWIWNLCVLHCLSYLAMGGDTNIASGNPAIR